MPAQPQHRQLFNFRFAEHIKIHLVFSFQNVIHVGNQAFQALHFQFQKSFLASQNLLPVIIRTVQNGLYFFQGHIKLPKE